MFNAQPLLTAQALTVQALTVQALTEQDPFK
jgi:hypothetical protein